MNCLGYVVLAFNVLAFLALLASVAGSHRKGPT